MKRKLERVELTLAQWQAACEVIREYAPEYYPALLTITPITLKLGNSTADTLIQFTKNQKTTLKDIVYTLSHNTQVHSLAFIQSCIKALISPKAYLPAARLLPLGAEINPLPLPDAVISTHIAPQLSGRALSSLMCISRFFHSLQAKEGRRPRPVVPSSLRPDVLPQAK